MSKSLQRGILFSICVALVLALSLTLVFFAGGGDKNILSAPQGQVSNAVQNTTSYTHGSNIGRQVPSGVKTVSTGSDFITAVSDNQSVSLASDVTLGWNEFGIQAEGIGGWSVDKYTGTIYGNGYTVSLSGLNTTGEVYPASGFNNKPYAGGIVRELGDELGNGGAIYDLNVVVNGHIRVLGASGQYLDLGILVGQMNGNSTIDNCTVTVNNGKSVESMKMSSSIPWARLGLFVGKFADNASNMRITNVTATHNGTIEVGLGTTSGWGGTAGGGNTDESAQGFAGLIFGAASKSATNITLDNIVVAGSGVIWSYAGAPIGMLMGNTAVTINNFFNKTTNGSLFNNIKDNRSSNTILDFERNGDNVRGRVVNHYRSSHAQQATADDNNGINVTNTITVSDDNIGKIYFDPKVSDYANSLTIVHDTSNRPVDSANERTYTITGQNNYSATSEEITLNGSYDRVIFRNLSSTASNWNNGGNFGYNVTYKDTPKFQIPKDPIPFYEHGYVAESYVPTGTAISSGTAFEDAFANGGQAVSGDYYLSKDIAISGFYGESFSGTLDGNGHTIYITGARQEGYGNAAVGGLTGTLTGTIKNVRVVLVDEAGEVSLIKNNDKIKSSRIGVLVGKVDGGTLENVQVVVESGATLKADMTTAGADNDMAMGGVVGGTNNATLHGVTMELNGKLDPHGSWTFVGAMAGKIEGTTTFENVILRGNGTLAGHATNGANGSGQPVFAGALGVTSISSTSPTRTVTVNGLIYDFDVTLAGTMRDGAAGDSNGSYSCYYILTNNYNDGMTGGDVTEREPISQYNGAASYSNVFIASDYVTELEGYAKFRTNGNAPIGLGSTTPYTIARNVSSAAGRYDDASVTAYFQPVTTTIGTSYNYEAGDLVLKVSGHAWAADESLLVNVGGDTGNVISYLEDPASTSSDRIVALSKDEAAAAAQGNSNTVQVREFRHVAQPQLADELTYTGSGIEVAFVVRYESESGAGQMGEELPSSAYTVSINKKEGGTGSVVDGKPVNAGEYVATITLTRGDTFLGSGTGGDSDTATVEFTVAPYLVEGTWELSGLTLTYGDPVPSDIDQYIRVTLTSQNIPGGLNAVKAKGFTTDYAQGAPAGTTVNITADTYTIDASLTASNYDLSGITGSGSVPVQKKTLTIDPVSTEPDHMYDPHISAVYGATGDKAAVQGMLQRDVIDKYIKGNYNGEKVTFTIDKIYIAAFDETGAFTLENAEEVADENVASLGANSYLITVTADGDNYTFAEEEFFVYGVIPVTLTVTGVAFEGDFDGVYDGQAHNVTVQYSGELVGGDAPYNFGISINEIDGISVTDAGDYVVTVQADEENVNYDIKFENDVSEYVVTISPITLTISDKSGVYTELTAADIVIDDMVSGILEGDTSGVTITHVWDTQPAYENEYLAAGTYNATLSLSGDKSGNYTFGTDNVATVKVDPFDLRGAFVTITSEQFTFDGTEKTVEYTVLTAEGGKDITALLTPAGNKQTNANDNYTLTLTGGDNFTGTATAAWSIGKRTLSVTEPTALTFLDKKASELFAYLTTGNWITGFVGSDGYMGNLWVNNPAENAVTIGDVAYAAAGTYTLSINLTGSNANNNYALSVNELSVTINAFDLSNAEMTVEALTYNGEEQTAPVAVTANGVNVTSLLTVSGNTATAAGSNYTAKAEAQDGNFTGSIERPFTVAQKQLKLERLTLSSVTYTGEAITVTGYIFAAEFGPAGVEKPVLVIAPQGSDPVVNAGEYTFNVSLAADNEVNKNYVMAEGAGTITATVSPASVTVTAAQEAKFGVDFGEKATAETRRFYESDFITLSAQPDETFTLADALTFTVKNSETQEEVRAAEDGVYTLAPGTYTVTYTINNIEGANYTLTADDELTTTLTVEEGARKLAIETWENTTLTYKGAAQLPTPVFADSAEIGQLPEGALVYEVTAKEGSTLTGTDAVNAGAYTVTVSIAPDFAEQYELAGDKLSADFTIEQLEVVLEWEAVGDLVYNGEEHTAVATVFNKVGDDDVKVIVALVNGNKNVNVGEFFYEATGLSGAAADNYSLPAEKRHAFNVTPAQVELTWNFKENAAIVYGDGVEAVKELVDIAALNGTIPGATDPLTFEVSVGNYSVTTGAGTEVTFTVSYTLPDGALEKNYHITLEAAKGKDKLTVGKATLTLTIAETASRTKVYDGEAVTLDSLLTADNVVVKGMKNGENAFDLKILRISASQQEMTNAAVYDGIVIEIINDCNYIAEPLEITYTITPKPIGVEWRNTELTYNGTAQAPTATATGLVDSESLTLNVSGAQTDANAEGQPYTATVTAESVTGNYKLENDATVEFTIARKSVSVAWSNTQLTYNGTAQAPTAEIAEDGLIGEDEVILTVSGAQTDANQGDESYTATAAITGGADMGNYVLDESSASTAFTIKPKTVNVTLTANSGDTIDFNVAGSVKAGAWTADGDNRATLTLSDGANTVTLTAEANEALPLIEGAPALVLLLDDEPYEGTPYGTKVQGGKLTVRSADTNYVFEVAQAVTVNITPAITVSLKADVQTTVALEVVLGDTTYNAEYFKNNYFQVTGKDGAEVTGGTLKVTITPSEGLAEGAIKHAGAYTVKAEYTPAGAQAGAELPNYSFTFTVTPVEVTSVTYSGKALTYGALGASGEITVTVEYADGTRAEKVTAQYDSANVSTGGWLKAGSTQVKVNYAGENSDYAAVKDHAVTLSIKKLDITATLRYAEQSGTSLTLPYNGRTGYSVEAELLGIKDGDGVSARADGDFVDVHENISATIMLDGDDKDNYNVTGNYSVTITPAEIGVGWSGYEDLTYDGTAKVPVATATGTLDGDSIDLTIVISGNNATGGQAVNAGEYIATVKAATYGNYKLSADSEQAFTVDKAKATLTIKDYDALNGKTYDGNPVPVIPMIDGQEDTQDIVTVIITDKTVYDKPVKVDEMVNAGQYTITLQIQNSMNYADNAGKDFPFTVTPVEITVEWSGYEDLTYDGTAKVPAATAKGTLNNDVVELTVTVTGDNATDDGQAVNAGDYTATVKAFTDGNYKLSADSTQAFTVAKANVTIVWGEQTEFVYSGAAVVPSADVQFNDESVGTATVTCAGDNLAEGQAIDVGNYTATAVFAGDDNFNAASDESFAFEITKATLTVTPEKDSFSERDADKMAAYAKNAFENTIKGLVTVIGVGTDGEISDFHVTDNGATYQTDGEHLAVGVHKYSITDAEGNYESFTFTVEVTAQEMITITATPDSPVYTGSEIGFTYTAAKDDDTEFDMAGVTVEIASVKVTLPSTDAESPATEVKDAGDYTVTFTVTAQDDTYYYVATPWVGNIEQATVSVQQATGVYGQIVSNAGTISGTFTTPFVVFNGQPVDVRIAYNGGAAGAALLAEGDIFLAAGAYGASVSLNDYNFKWEDEAAYKESTFVVAKKTVKLDYTPSSTSFSASGISFTLEDHTAAQVGEDSLTVQIVIDGVPVDPLDPPVLNAGEHTVTYRIGGSGAENYDFKPVKETFTLAARMLDPEITVDGQDEISNGGTLNMTYGEQRNILSAINGYLERNNVPASDWTITVSGGKELNEVNRWEPGTYTVTVAFSGNHYGSMTFTVTVSDQAPLPEIPDAPVLPETPLTEAEDGGAGWLFPLLIAIVALIDVALVVAIIIVAKKRA